LSSSRDRWQARFDNILKPFAMPAALGVFVTLLGFGILLDSLTPTRALAAEDYRSVASVGVYQQPRTSDSTLKRLRAVGTSELDQALSIQGEVNNAGRIDDFTVIGGMRSPGVDQWLQELVLMSQFRPATYWGLPVRSRVIFSFVTVRG
jgi:hypothetical protein